MGHIYGLYLWITSMDHINGLYVMTISMGYIYGPYLWVMLMVYIYGSYLSVIPSVSLDRNELGIERCLLNHGLNPCSVFEIASL